MNILKIIIQISLCILILILFISCAPIVETKIEQVMVPVKCELTMPSRPISSRNDPAYLKEILIYTETLEKDLMFCISGQINQKKN